jgi:hypothetical protein
MTRTSQARVGEVRILGLQKIRLRTGSEFIRCSSTPLFDA